MEVPFRTWSVRKGAGTKRQPNRRYTSLTEVSFSFNADTHMLNRKRHVSAACSPSANDSHVHLAVLVGGGILLLLPDLPPQEHACDGVRREQGGRVELLLARRQDHTRIETGTLYATPERPSNGEQTHLGVLHELDALAAARWRSEREAEAHLLLSNKGRNDGRIGE